MAVTITSLDWRLIVLMGRYTDIQSTCTQKAALDICHGDDPGTLAP